VRRGEGVFSGKREAAGRLVSDAERTDNCHTNLNYSFMSQPEFAAPLRTLWKREGTGQVKKVNKRVGGGRGGGGGRRKGPCKRLNDSLERNVWKN